MANIDHIMPKPVVVPIFWGDDYVANPDTANKLQQMLSDLVTGPFMNGLAQYGVQRGSVSTPVIVPDNNPPVTIIYKDTNNNLKDDITKQLIKWINAGTVPPPPSPSDINQLYLILPPPGTPGTTFETYNGASDPIGNGIQGWHNEGKTDPPSPPTYYWAIGKTNDTGVPISSARDFANAVATQIGHELVEQFADRDGSFEELGDPCQCRNFTYRGWGIQQYWSEWDNRCISGDNPVSLKQFLNAIGFDFEHNGLGSLGTSILNIDYIALTMQSKDSAQGAPSKCFNSPELSANPQSNQLGYYLSYAGKGFPAGVTVELFMAGLTGHTAPFGIGYATADSSGNFNGVYSFRCTSQLASPNAFLQAQDPPSHWVIVSTPVSFDCTP